MMPILAAIGDSATFMEDQLEALGISLHSNPTVNDQDISAIGNLAARLVRIRRAPGSRSALEDMQYQFVADCFYSLLGRELALIPVPKPVAAATHNLNQMSLFGDERLPAASLSSAA